MPALGERLKHAWNAFMNRDPTNEWRPDLGYSSYWRPDRVRLSRGNEQSIVTTIFNRIAVDVAAVDIRHARVDEDGRYLEKIDSKLNTCLELDANIDQTGRALIQDIVLSMFDEGVVAVVPTDTTMNPTKTGSYEIEKLRTGKIVQWFPEYVRVNLYNEKTGQRDDVTLPKKMVAIIENPFYSIMNEPNSILQRLIRTLNRLDIVNENNASGKLDLIIQLPYVVKTDIQKEQAEKRRKAIEEQLIGSKYGIAYTDGTEHITQLNRPAENTLWTQAKELMDMLYNQLGLTKTIFDGTADEKTMINYHNQTIAPILSEITLEFKRKFLTKTAISQYQSIIFYRDPFKLVPVKELAEIADKFTRNEIATSNEMRSEIGWRRSDDPNADELRNKNLNRQADPNQTAQSQMTDEQIDAEIERLASEGYSQEEIVEQLSQ